MVSPLQTLSPTMFWAVSSPPAHTGHSTSLDLLPGMLLSQASMSEALLPDNNTRPVQLSPKSYLIEEVPLLSFLLKETVSHSLPLSILTMSLSDIKWYVCLFIVEWISPRKARLLPFLLTGSWLIALSLVYSEWNNITWISLFGYYTIKSS